MAADLSGLDLVALMVDGVGFAEHLCVVALGIGIDGTERPSLRWGGNVGVRADSVRGAGCEAGNDRRCRVIVPLAHLRCGDTYARLAGGFGVGLAAVYRYVTETVDLIATFAPTLNAVARRAASLVWVILDGTLIPIDRVADQKPYFNGHKRRHGVNVQFLADASGRLLWTSAALPGTVYDLTAARIHAVPDQLARHAVACLADKAYKAAGPTIAVALQGQAAVRQPTGRQPQHRQGPRARRTRRRHREDLAHLDQAALLPTPRHPAPGRHHRAPTCGRRSTLATMRNVRCPLWVAD